MSELKNKLTFTNICDMKSYVSIWKLVLLCLQSYNNANIHYLHNILPFTEHFYYISHLNCIKTVKLTGNIQFILNQVKIHE